MQSPCIDACKSFNSTSQQLHLYGFLTRPLSLSPSKLTFTSTCNSFAYPRLWCNFSDGGSRNPNREKPGERRGRSGGSGRESVNAKGKDNVWSIDNEIAKTNSEKGRVGRRKRGGGRVRNVQRKRKGDKIMVSGAMLAEDETVLQTQEPVIRPAWNTFMSSVSGIWKGVGAVFSPITAAMEPIDIGNKDEHLYDCYTLSHIEVMPSSSGSHKSEIRRRINWVTLNPRGEKQQLNGGSDKDKEKYIGGDASLIIKETSGGSQTNGLPKFESYDFGKSDVMEEDVMGMEPGLVFFEDGSYSRGPVDIPVGEFDESKYYLSPTFKFEQCLVKGCHKRLRIVHTIEFRNGGSDIQIMRVAVYEEQWVSPANIPDWSSDMDLDMVLFSQRKRVQPSELTGSWKVFEMSATPIYDEDIPLTEESNGSPYLYICMETLKNRSLPESSAYFGEEEILDMQDVTVLWLPGGVTGYVDVNKDGVLCIGVGWYSEEGINLVMERDYGVDGKLKEVRWKSEVKRRWSDIPV